MKAIILCAGYGKRMWPLTLNTPKALLPVKGRPVIEYLLQNIEKIRQINEIIISTNLRFSSLFKEWLSKYSCKKIIRLIVEPSTEEANKLGAIGSLHYVIRQINTEDTLVVSSDNLFDFDLRELVEFYYKKSKSCILLYNIIDTSKAAGKYGVVEVDIDNKVIRLEEKPQNPKSTLISCACYIFKEEDIKLINRYIEEGNNPDHLGHFIDWLSKESEVFGLKFDGSWFDIGSIEDYNRLINEKI